MAPVKSSMTKWELEFLGEPIPELPDDHLPTLGEVFRNFYHHRQTLHRLARHRDVAVHVVNKCIEIWQKFGIPTALGHNLTRVLVKLVTLFKNVQYFKKAGTFRRMKKETLWRRKLESVFNVAAFDAMDKCSRKNRKLLQALEKESEELKDLEKRTCWKRKLDEGEIPELAAVDETSKKRASRRRAEGAENAVPRVDETVREKRTRVKRKVEVEENEEHDVKKCKVLLSKLKATTDSDDELKIEDVSKTHKAKKRSTRSSLIDVQPDDEDIVPPNLPSIIVKEELDINWDENDEVKAFFAGCEEYSFDNCSVEKEFMISDKLGLHNNNSFIENIDRF